MISPKGSARLQCQSEICLGQERDVIMTFHKVHCDYDCTVELHNQPEHCRSPL